MSVRKARQQGRMVIARDRRSGVSEGSSVLSPYARSDRSRTAAFFSLENASGSARPNCPGSSREARKLRASWRTVWAVFEYGDPSGLIDLGEGSKMRPSTAAPNTRQEHSKLTPRLYRGPLLVLTKLVQSVVSTPTTVAASSSSTRCTRKLGHEAAA
jgi:hypothetical protein